MKSGNTIELPRHQSITQQVRHLEHLDTPDARMHVLTRHRGNTELLLNIDGPVLGIQENLPSPDRIRHTLRLSLSTNLRGPSGIRPLNRDQDREMKHPFKNGCHQRSVHPKHSTSWAGRMLLRETCGTRTCARQSPEVSRETTGRCCISRVTGRNGTRCSLGSSSKDTSQVALE
jgi:hypothetical protein